MHLRIRVPTIVGCSLQWIAEFDLPSPHTRRSLEVKTSEQERLQRKVDSSSELIVHKDDRENLEVLMRTTTEAFMFESLRDNHHWHQVSEALMGRQ